MYNVEHSTHKYYPLLLLLLYKVSLSQVFTMTNLLLDFGFRKR